MQSQRKKICVYNRMIKGKEEESKRIEEKQKEVNRKRK